MASKDKFRHHYVPQCLLKRFKSKDNTFFLYDLDYQDNPDNYKKEKIMEKMSVRNYFMKIKDNSFINSNGEEDNNTIEDLFGRIESVGMKSILKAIKGDELEYSDKRNIGGFIALQLSRIPNVREETERFMFKSLKMMLESYPDTEEHTEIRKLIDENKIDIEVNHQASLITLSSLDDLAFIISNMNFTVLEANWKNTFIISDNPCTIFDFERPDLLSGIAPLSSPRVEIILPISPQYCISATWRESPLRKKLTSEENININKRSAIFADKLMCSSSQSDSLFKFFNKYKNVSVRMDSFDICNDEIDGIYNSMNTPVDKYSLVEYKKISPLFRKYNINYDLFFNVYYFMKSLENKKA